MCLTMEMEHNVERCVGDRHHQQHMVLERLRERVKLLREEIQRIIELSEYVEDIANSESNIRTILEEISSQNVTVSEGFGSKIDMSLEKRK